MQKRKVNTIKLHSLPMLSLGLGIFAFLVCSGAVPAQTTRRYSPEECVRCHPSPVYDLEAAGGNHRNIPCAGCHAGHPPEVTKPVALCSTCHLTSRNAHYETPGCHNCHTNTHTPLRMSFKDARTEDCLVCHGLQGWVLRKYESKHSSLDCSKCHDVHRKFPPCTRCHVPHSGKIAGGCNLCHKAHMPKLSAYPDAAPSEDCGMCHKIVAGLFRATTSKHKSLSCTFCHQQRHRMIPACENCHGTPHPKDMMARFPKCGECHNIAHDINWTAEETVETPELAAKHRR